VTERCSGWLLKQLLWCQIGAMKRLNLRDVPDDVYEALVAAAEASGRSLNSFVVDRLRKTVELLRLPGYVDSYLPPSNTSISLEEAAAAIRAARDAQGGS